VAASGLATVKAKNESVRPVNTSSWIPASSTSTDAVNSSLRIPGTSGLGAATR
jgi:hypothetical protein